MTDPVHRPEVGDELWVAVPPGWIELAAHDDDDEALRWFDRLLDQTPDLFDDAARAGLRETYAQVRREIPHGVVDAAGVLFTSTEGDDATMWQFTITVVAGPPSGDINLMAVVERYLASAQGGAPLGDDDLVESFQTADGRDGVAIHTTTAVEDGRLESNVPGTEPDQLGVVCAAVRLHRTPSQNADRLAIVTGVAPSLAQRLPMSIVAAQLTLSASLRDSDAPAPAGRIDIDASGHRRDERDRAVAPRVEARP